MEFKTGRLINGNREEEGGREGRRTKGLKWAEGEGEREGESKRKIR